MNIDKTVLSENLLILANAVNENAAKLNLSGNKIFYCRLSEFDEALRTPEPKFAKIICVEDMEIYGYHIVQRVKIDGQYCFLLGEAQVGLIIQKISENQDIGSGKGGEIDG